MTEQTPVRLSRSSMLMRALENNPQLPALIPKLRTPTLTRLIEAVGVEDAGAIVAHTTTGQLQRVFDEVLWKSMEPGGTERMSPETFIRWLEVLNDQGDAFVSERLESLGLQFAVSQFAQVVEVHDQQQTFDAMDDAAESFGAYLVIARFVEEWDVIRSALLALDTDYPDFLAAVLGNVGTVMRFSGVERRAISAREDEAHDRDQRRAADGYLTRHGAQELLALARTRSLPELVAMSKYDDLSRRYLEVAGTDDGSAQLSAVEAAGIEELSALLAEAEVIPRTMRLAGPEDASPRRLPIRELLDQLERDNPDCFADRLRELVLLANVLVAGTTDRGERFSEVEAANAALSISNLGAGYLISQAGIELDVMLSEPPGLMRAFSVGWHILHRIPQRAARYLVATLRTEDVRRRLAAREWILNEVDLAIADLVNRVDLGKFGEVADTLSFVSLVIEAETCERLAVLISEFPRLPLEAVPGDRVAVRSRHLDSLDDLREVDEFLNELPQHIKL